MLEKARASAEGRIEELNAKMAQFEEGRSKDQEEKQKAMQVRGDGPGGRWILHWD
jgi:hypothetical protein